MVVRVRAPLSEECVRSLRAGDRVLVDGVLYAARDAAHRRMFEAMERGEALPIDVAGQIIYYVGPCPPKPGAVIGSAGPTTSARMDAYAPALIRAGLRGMIGKGYRSPEVGQAMVEYGAVYLVATGGAAALLSDRIVAADVVAYDDLGPEALRRLVVEGFPAVVAIDALGANLYEKAPALWRR